MTENEMRGVNTILEGALCAAELSTRSPGFHRLAFPHIYSYACFLTILKK
jgi:hypothetical protein